MDAVSSSTSSDMTAIFQDMIQRRQKRQEESIAKGLASGKLTSDQATQLEKLEDQTSQQTTQALADGQISNDEFKSIMDSYSDNGRQIFQLKHPNAPQQGQQGQQAQQAQTGQSADEAKAAHDAMMQQLQLLAQTAMTDRESRLDSRLQKGVAAGKYTADQQVSLQKLQTQATQDLAAANADGTVSAAEFLQVMKDQNAFSRAMRSYNSPMGNLLASANTLPTAQAAASGSTGTSA